MPPIRKANDKALLSPSNPKVNLSKQQREELETSYRGWNNGSSLVKAIYAEYEDTPKVTQELHQDDDGNLRLSFQLHTTLSCNEPNCEVKFECRAKPNNTKLLKAILACPLKSDDCKERIARMGRSEECQTYLCNL